MLSGGILMCTDQEYNIIIDRIAKAYRAVYGAQLDRVLVYGSYARGDYDDFSDIDLVAIVRGNRSELQESLKKVWDVSSDLELEYETIVSPTVIPYDEFEQYRDDLPYYRNIANEGVRINA